MMPGTSNILTYSFIIAIHLYRDDAQSKKMALKEKTEKEITQYNMELKVFTILEFLFIKMISVVLGVDTCD